MIAQRCNVAGVAMPVIASQTAANSGHSLRQAARRRTLDEGRPLRPPEAAGGEPRQSHNGAYWQAFGWKKQARSLAVRISACAAGTMFERETSRVIPWCEGARRVPPSLRRAFAARFLLPATVGGGRHTLRISA